MQFDGRGIQKRHMNMHQTERARSKGRCMICDRTVLVGAAGGTLDFAKPDGRRQVLRVESSVSSMFHCPLKSFIVPKKNTPKPRKQPRNTLPVELLHNLPRALRLRLVAWIVLGPLRSMVGVPLLHSGSYLPTQQISKRFGMEP